jgi:hypothetical protein
MGIVYWYALSNVYRMVFKHFGPCPALVAVNNRVEGIGA